MAQRDGDGAPPPLRRASAWARKMTSAPGCGTQGNFFSFRRVTSGTTVPVLSEGMTQSMKPSSLFELSRVL